MLTKLQKWGNSQGVRIPKHLLSLGFFKKGDEFEIIAEYDKIVIHRPQIPKKYTLQELFAEYRAGEHSSEVDWGKPVGKEEW